MVKLHEIYFIFKDRGLPALHTRFREAERVHPDLISSFISAISHFAKELRPDERKDINLISREDFVIMIEDGNKIFAALIADRDDRDARVITQKLINAFEEEFDKNLDDFGVNTLIFEKFKDTVVKEFGVLLINPFYFPVLLKTDKELPNDPLCSKIINLIDGERNINEIAYSLSLPMEEVCQIISLLESRNLIELQLKIEEADIFSPTEKATEAFSRETKDHRNMIELFGEVGIDVLYSLDGKKDLKEIMNELQLPFNDLLKMLKYFLTEEFISWIELYPVMRPLSTERLLEIASTKGEQALVFTLRNICDGSYSLSSISRKLKIPKDEIRKFLDKFGRNVRWIEKKI